MEKNHACGNVVLPTTFLSAL